MKELDTIVAISTSIGESAINIVRISGNDAIKIVNKHLLGLDLNTKDGNTISYAKFIRNDNSLVDEVLVSLFRAPKSYTKEDVIEINTHGGSFVTSEVVDSLIEEGARIAEPGEFTKRAFMNGRLDLSQAESVMDMINSKTKESLDLANKALRGDIKKLIEELRLKIEDILLHIEVNIDYPEYTDELQVTKDIATEKIKELINEISSLIENANEARIYKEGLKTAIIGKPNTGKSSLLNSLTHKERAIVTDISGTTRDTIEEDINVSGVILHLIDTAGIRESSDIVEKIGIEKSIDALKEAELVLLVIDSSKELEDDDYKLLDLTKDKKRIILLNKCDLKQVVELKEENVISISSKDNINIDKLKQLIKSMFIKGEIKSSSSIISSSRHIGILKKTLNSLNNAYNSTLNNEFIDLIEIDLKEAYNALGEIIGKTNPDELLDSLFSKFCLGK